MGPPPAPSSGASGSGFGDFNQQASAGGQNREGGGQRGGRGGGPPGSGHHRRHSLALPEAKRAAELAQQKRTTAGFQFPVPGAGGATPTSTNRSTSPSELNTPSTELEDNKSGQEKQDQGNGNLTPQGSLTARSGNRGGAHGRSQSMAAGPSSRGHSQGRGGSFQFPSPASTNDNSANTQNAQDFQRRGSSGGHNRSASRNFEGNWRQQNNNQGQDQQGSLGQHQIMNQNQNPGAGGFQPGHRTRPSMGQSIGSIGAFQYTGQPQLMQLPPGAQAMLLQQPQLFGGQQIPQLQINQLQALQAAQMNGQLTGLQGSQHAQPQMSAQQQQQQQRKTLFTPYLPQASLPALLSDGQLVAGILRVNKKNRSDAYVSTQDGLLDADIFICGSKDRNRALEGDLVAVELLDVDEVWGQKREKEEKKKRKDTTDNRGGSGPSNVGSNDKIGRSDSTGGNDDKSAANGEGGLKRRGSLRVRHTQKKNDDVEVEGQSLLLVEEEEVNDEQKPLYAGHVVAVIERVAGQMFSG